MLATTSTASLASTGGPPARAARLGVTVRGVASSRASDFAAGGFRARALSSRRGLDAAAAVALGTVAASRGGGTAGTSGKPKRGGKGKAKPSGGAKTSGSPVSQAKKAAKKVRRGRGRAPDPPADLPLASTRTVKPNPPAHPSASTPPRRSGAPRRTPPPPPAATTPPSTTRTSTSTSTRPSSPCAAAPAARARRGRAPSPRR